MEAGRAKTEAEGAEGTTHREALKKQLVDRAKKSQDAYEKSKQLVEALTAERDTLKSVTDEQIKAGQAAAAALDKKIQASRESSAALEEERKNIQRVAVLNDQRLKLETQREADEERKKAAEKAASQAKETAREQESARKERQSRMSALGGIQFELEMLRMKAAGQNKAATALEREVRLRSEARSLAEAAGISEQQAIAMLREKARLEEQISNRNKGRGRGLLRPGEQSRIRSNAGGLGFGGSINAGGGERLGLKSFVSNSRTQARAKDREATLHQQTISFYEKTLTLQEQSLEQFRKLGAV